MTLAESPFVRLLRKHWPLLCLLLATAALQALGLRDALAYNREAIDQGRWWLLATGSLVHSNIAHWLMNAVALAILWLIVDGLRGFAWLLCIALLINGLALYVLEPQLQFYVGLSGVLHTLFVAGAMQLLTRDPRTAALLLAFVICKVLAEQLGIRSVGSLESVIGLRVATEAHLWGALIGLLIATPRFCLSISMPSVMGYKIDNI